jgi:hypothetical protein
MFRRLPGSWYSFWDWVRLTVWGFLSGNVKYETLSTGEVSKTPMEICGVFWPYNKRRNIPPVQVSVTKIYTKRFKMLTMPSFTFYLFSGCHCCRIWRRVSSCVGTNVTEELLLTSSGYVLRQPEDEAARCTITLLHIQQSTQRHITEDSSSAAVRHANLAFIHFVWNCRPIYSLYSVTNDMRWCKSNTTKFIKVLGVRWMTTCFRPSLLWLGHHQVKHGS